MRMPQIGAVLRMGPHGLEGLVIAMDTEPEDLMTLSEAASYFGIPLGTIKTWCHRRRIPSWKRRSDGLLMVRKEDIQWIRGADRVQPMDPTAPS